MIIKLLVLHRSEDEHKNNYQKLKKGRCVLSKYHSDLLELYETRLNYPPPPLRINR